MKTTKELVDGMQVGDTVTGLLRADLEEALQAERQKREEVVEAETRKSILEFAHNLLTMIEVRQEENMLATIEANALAYRKLTQPNNPEPKSKSLSQKFRENTGREPNGRDLSAMS